MINDILTKKSIRKLLQDKKDYIQFQHDYPEPQDVIDIPVMNTDYIAVERYISGCRNNQDF
jgi:hypothetical protein